MEEVNKASSLFLSFAKITCHIMSRKERLAQKDIELIKGDFRSRSRQFLSFFLFIFFKKKGLVMLHTHSHFHDKYHKTWNDLTAQGSGAPKHRRYELMKGSKGNKWIGDIGCYSPSAKKSKRYFNKQIRHVPLDETDTLMYGKYHKIVARKITSNMYD